MTPHTRIAGQEAIVIGASLGGLLAARALADCYDQVTVLERDALPAAPENRKGVPQGRHAHALLRSGQQLLEDFFPGLTDEILRQGGILGDATGQARRVISGYPYARFHSGQPNLYSSRPLLEAAVRARVLGLPNVRVFDNCDVLGLAVTPDKTVVTGVRLIRRAPGSAEETLNGDLVVDASGRGSRSPAWLEALGYARPAEEQVRVNAAYATRLYQRRADHADGALVVNITAAPPNRRMGVMLAIEADRWIVTLAGYLGDHPPSDPQGFEEFARGLPAPDIYHIIRAAQPLSDPLPAKYPASIRRRYDLLERFPAGYLVFGDALASFNPVYGQGMSVAALEAAALRESLAYGSHDLARRFFRAAGSTVEIAWRLATGGDLRFAEVEGQRTALQTLINRYLVGLHRAAQHDPELVSAFGVVINLLAPPASLLHPRLALRVLLGNLRLAGPTRQTRQRPGGAIVAG
jgi:2-polyprenyl-6-methoxyphenol hydroxylase-like FAD-dependent oxidoreductase